MTLSEKAQGHSCLRGQQRASRLGAGSGGAQGEGMDVKQEDIPEEEIALANVQRTMRQLQKSGCDRSVRC